jgi:hypothetical protein
MEETMLTIEAGMRLGAGLILGIGLLGCASTPQNVSPMPPMKYEVLGKASGKACGSLGILATGYHFIPMGVNSRVEKAYQNALSSVPGATGLINVEVQEDWYWWFIGTARCVRISADAIKEAA